MKYLLMNFLILIILSGISAQNNQPQVDIKINKEFDENGNIIRYDSVYTYFYSSNSGTKLDSSFIDNNFAKFEFDMNPFGGFTTDSTGILMPRSFKDFFGNDDFFTKDPLFEHFNKMHEQLLEKMKKETDIKDEALFDESETFTF